MIQARDARKEAMELLPRGHAGQVLEPSPPANVDPAWFADDPTSIDGDARTAVTPIPGEGVEWADLAEHDPAIARFAADHWLDGRRRLDSLPDGYDAGRRALHQVAYFAVGPKRYDATGKLGLRYTHKGYGTPFFKDPEGHDEQIRVEGRSLIRQVGSDVYVHDLTTLRSATLFLGIHYEEVWFEGFHDPPAPLGADTELTVEPDVTDAIGAWFGFATHVLERARRTPGADDVSRVQLWPEHFDVAFEMGAADQGRRASYGASPGDDAHPEPYVYVVGWDPIDRSDPFWADPTINGASLGYDALLESADPYSTALEFYHDAHRRLNH